jgi:hypothetical protein
MLQRQILYLPLTVTGITNGDVVCPETFVVPAPSEITKSQGPAPVSVTVTSIGVAFPHCEPPPVTVAVGKALIVIDEEFCAAAHEPEAAISLNTV